MWSLGYPRYYFKYLWCFSWERQDFKGKKLFEMNI